MRTLRDKVRDRLWLTVNWYSLDLTARSQTEPAEKTDVYFRPMRQDDLDRLFRKFPEELTERKYRILKNRLSEAGKEVFVAETSTDETPAGYFCTSVTDTFVGETKKTLSVPAGTVYLFDDYVFEQYRGKRIHEQSIRFRTDRYKLLSCTKAFVGIVAANKTSFNSYNKSGFRYVRSETRIGPVGCTVTWRKG